MSTRSLREPTRPGAVGPDASFAIAPGYIRASNGASLSFRSWGTGKPVVFLHAWSLPQDMWVHQMLPLSEQGFRCISYDRRGHGRSTDPGVGYDYDTLSDDLACVLEALDLRKRPSSACES